MTMHPRTTSAGSARSPLRMTSWYHLAKSRSRGVMASFDMVGRLLSTPSRAAHRIRKTPLDVLVTIEAPSIGPAISRKKASRRRFQGDEMDAMLGRWGGPLGGGEW